MNRPMEAYLQGGVAPEPEDGSMEMEMEAPEAEVSFTQPDGFALPEGIQEGETFDAMATVKLVGGQLVLAELDGSPVGGLPAPAEDEEPLEEDMEMEMEDESDMEMEDESDMEGEEEGDDALDFLAAIEKKSKKTK